MKNKANFIHFLVVPVITILVCNGVTMSLARMSSLGLGFLMVTLIVCYGMYLHFFRITKAQNIIVIGITSILGLGWSCLYIPDLMWLAGFVLLFSMMRSLVLQKNIIGFGHDLVWTSLGAGVGVFLYPASFSLGLFSFLIVQIMHELREAKEDVKGKKDRFNDSLKMANEVMKKWA